MKSSIKIELERKRKDTLANSRRIVIKIGSGVLTGESYDNIDENYILEIARQIALLCKSGKKVALVSSGSVALGSKMLAKPRYGLSIPLQQASAALGQSRLVTLWSRCFKEFGIQIGQLLLTHDDLSSRRRFLNARNTVNTLIDFNIIPLINENDTVAVHELKFGDNDSLSAKVTNLMEADLLVILSDVDGLYSEDPRLVKDASLIPIVKEIDDKIEGIAADSSSRSGLGGMKSKVIAAKEASRFGAATVIIKGRREGAIEDLLIKHNFDAGGTFFFPHEDRLSSKKHWIEFTLPSRGEITVDEGAKEALTNSGKSLLALGIKTVIGEFGTGEAVNISDSRGVVFAKGLVNYNSAEIAKIQGKHSNKIETVLGYKFYDEVIHRNDMVLMDK
ncbi:MAG: glutamate 5-kinase [Nitrospinota bacterium]